jgi:hypothetical protein
VLMEYSLFLSRNSHYLTAHQIRRIYKALEFIGFETGAFSQLTRRYVQEQFNPKTPDADGVRSAVPT